MTARNMEFEVEVLKHQFCMIPPDAAMTFLGAIK
jgi:hypothetical protein